MPATLLKLFRNTKKILNKLTKKMRHIANSDSPLITKATWFTIEN